VGEALAPDVGERLPVGRALRIAWGVRSVWLIAGMYFLMYGVVNAFQGLWAVPWLIDARGLTRPEAAAIQSWWAWGTVVGGLSWGLLSDRVLHTRKSSGLVGFVLFGLAWAPMTLLPSLPLLALTPLMFLAGFGSASVVVTSPIVMELLPRQVVGTAIGLVNATPFLGAAVYQYGIGLALDAFGRAPGGAYLPGGYQTVFAFCLASIVGGTLLMLPVRERGR
jgi:sugar phosphate permease